MSTVTRFVYLDYGNKVHELQHDDACSLHSRIDFRYFHLSGKHFKPTAPTRTNASSTPTIPTLLKSFYTLVNPASLPLTRIMFQLGRGVGRGDRDCCLRRVHLAPHGEC